jgi:hypothetical protein
LKEVSRSVKQTVEFGAWAELFIRDMHGGYDVAKRLLTQEWGMKKKIWDLGPRNNIPSWHSLPRFPLVVSSWDLGRKHDDETGFLTGTGVEFYRSVAEVPLCCLCRACPRVAAGEGRIDGFEDENYNVISLLTF